MLQASISICQIDSAVKFNCSTISHLRGWFQLWDVLDRQHIPVPRNIFERHTSLVEEWVNNP